MDAYSRIVKNETVTDTFGWTVPKTSR